MKRTQSSAYMEWAKTESQARFNLATSGLTSVVRAEFPLRLEELEVTAPGAYGFPPLQRALAQHTGAPEECIVAATGTSMANHLAMAAVLEPGDEVLIEQPAYGLLLDLANYLGAEIRRFGRPMTTGFQVDPGEIERAITPKTRLIVLTNLHNPTGALLSREALRGIFEVAERAGIRVLVDEVYLEFLFEADAPFSFAIDQGIIVTSSLTKVYGLSGLRCGWILAEPNLARRIWRLNDLFGVNAAHPAERMSIIALQNIARFRERARARIEANRPLLDVFLDSRADLECFRPPAGPVVFPRLRRGTAENFAALLREKFETSVVPGAFFGMPEHFRIGIGGDTAELRAGLERLSDALDEFGSR